MRYRVIVIPRRTTSKTLSKEPLKRSDDMRHTLRSRSLRAQSLLDTVDRLFMKD